MVQIILFVGGYKANCKCKNNGECNWVLHPSFTCEEGCPHQHLAEIRVVRSWEDDKEEREGLHQIKLKVQFKPPAGEINGWRLLVKFG